jgi:kynurenine formamidase
MSTSVKRIGPETFQKAGSLEGRAILVYTGWDARVGRPDFYRDFPYITPEAACFLVESGIALLGVDTPSPDLEACPVRAAALFFTP